MWKALSWTNRQIQPLNSDHVTADVTEKCRHFPKLFLVKCVTYFRRFRWSHGKTISYVCKRDCQKKTCHFIYWSNNTTAALVIHILVYRKFVHFIRGHWTIRILPRFSYKTPRPGPPTPWPNPIWIYILHFWHAYSFNLFQGRKSENYIQIL